uniref:Uncharacterized protein n=1 Tax=Parascaris equorum TaxID=6256 RepID=A0A914RBG4_PAREQ
MRTFIVEGTYGFRESGKQNWKSSKDDKTPFICEHIILANNSFCCLRRSIYAHQHFCTNHDNIGKQYMGLLYRTLNIRLQTVM